MLAICLCCLVFFPHLILFNHTLMAGDTGFYHYPLRIYARERLINGELPLWNPHLFGGVPFLADVQSAVFYPFHLLYLIFPPPIALNCIIVLHIFLTASFSYIFARRSMSIQPICAFLSAFVFTFGGFVQTHVGTQIYLLSLPWMPLALLLYDEAKKRGSIVLFLMMGSCITLQFLSGGVQYAYYTFWLLIGYLFFTLFAQKAAHELSPNYDTSGVPTYSLQKFGGNKSVKTKTILLFFLSLCFGALLSSAQLLPTLELIPLGDRPMKAPYEFVTSGSLPIKHFLLTNLFPTLYGAYDRPEIENFSFAIFTTYVGVIPILLSIYALLSSRFSGWACFWAIVCVISFLLALGKANPIYQILYQLIPGFSAFRSPARFMLLYCFGLACLSGLGAEAFIRSKSTNAKKLFEPRQMILLGLSLIIPVISFITVYIHTRQTIKAPQSPYWEEQWGQVGMIALASISFAVIIIISRLVPQYKNRQAFLILMAIVCFLDYHRLSHHMEYQETVPVPLVTQTPKSVSYIKSQKGGDDFPRRFGYRVKVPMKRFQAGESAIGFTEEQWRQIAVSVVLELLPSNIPAMFRVDDLGGGFGGNLPLKRRLYLLYEPGKTLKEIKPWLNIMGVKYVGSILPIYDHSLKRIPSLHPLTHLYFNPHAFHRVFFADSFKIVKDGWEAYQLLVKNPNFDPRRLSYIELPQKTFLPSPTKNTADSGTCRLVEHHPERVIISYSSSHDVLIILSDPFYPGWQAFLNGKKQLQIYSANCVMRAVFAPNGSHTILMLFLPSSVKIGIFFSLLAISMFFGIISFFLAKN
ncbi:MAG: YfhO family protein [Armatimonadota bacterium]|nr:YfhO family protein [Armatimonadota bacterium]MCX7777781.1 YfhO family protein [Armatimonadota bacterium]MDW8025332.1 YfhO family protein [Armatimonadota bacterium]